MNKAIAAKPIVIKKDLGHKIKVDFIRNKAIYLLFLPVLLYFIIFKYFPIYGLVIAFKNYIPSRGILNSAWVGFDNFTRFFNSTYFVRLITNTLSISFLSVIFEFPAPIIFALLLNEIRNNVFKRTIQTITYLPHFISTMVICGMILDFSLKGGFFNDIAAFFGADRSDMLMVSNNFRPIYIISGMWQGIGWGSIIYLSALTSIDTQLYEAAYLDGANRFKQMLHVTLPGILPTISILFIMRIGSLMNVGFEKVFLLSSPVIYDKADVISTFVYRKGFIDADYSFSTAVGLFNSAINLALLFIANTISRKVNDNSLW